MATCKSCPPARSGARGRHGEQDTLEGGCAERAVLLHGVLHGLRLRGYAGGGRLPRTIIVCSRTHLTYIHLSLSCYLAILLSLSLPLPLWTHPSYFVVAGHYLKYYASAAMSELKAALDLAQLAELRYPASPEGEADRDFALVMVAGGEAGADGATTETLLRGATAEETAGWVAALRPFAEAFQQRRREEEEEEKARQNEDEGLEGGGGAETPGGADEEDEADAEDEEEDEEDEEEQQRRAAAELAAALRTSAARKQKVEGL